MRLEERIKQLRINKNMTMQQLADLSNLTKGYISMLEKGLNPSTKKADCSFIRNSSKSCQCV